MSDTSDHPGDTIGRHEGRRLFGGDVASYDRARPDYPERVYALLREKGVIFRGADVLEVGAGNGLATRRLLQMGANVVALEPDKRFRPTLEQLSSPGALDVRTQTFEDARFDPGSFNAVVCATSFHWLDPVPVLRRFRELLAAGGQVAICANVFQDLTRDVDPFHDATQSLLAPLAGNPSNTEVPFALDRASRFDEISRAGGYAAPRRWEFRWTLTLDAEGTRGLYATFSPINRLAPDERSWVLDGIRDVAEREFAGTVERYMTTSLYLVGRRDG